MSRSKAARRRRANGGGQVVPYGRMRPNITNWIVGPSLVSSAGALVSGSSWMLAGNAITLASGTPVTIQGAAIVAAPNTSTPTIGRMRIDEVHGRLSLSGFVSAGRYAVAVAIYVADQLSTTPTWETRDPLNSSFAAEDDYFMLEAHEFEAPATTTVVGAAQFMDIPLKLANPLVIGSGQAVHVTVSMIGANSLKLSTAFRTRVGPVA